MERLSIGEVARRVGVRASAIRFYEGVGLLPPPPRASGWRSFEPEIVDRLKVIRTARDLGFSLEEIRQLLDGFSDETPPPERWRALAAEKLPAIEAAIGRAQALRRMLLAGMSCHCVSIQQCFLEDCSAGLLKPRSLPIVTAPSTLRVESPRAATAPVSPDA